MSENNNLNTKQAQVVATTKGYLHVLAGAGTGKTHTLTQRYVHLLENGVDSKNILAVTFTNKAAKEMKKRIFAAVGTYPEGPVCTFHALCSYLLRRDGHAININPGFRIRDEYATFKDIQYAINKTGHSAKDIKIETAADIIKRYKNKIFKESYIKCKTAPRTGTLNWYADRSLNDSSRSWMEHAFWHYMKIQNSSNSMDYDDLINLGTELLKVAPVRQKWQEQFEYVMIDEYQDINEVQYELMATLTDHHKNLMVVGDPNQTIYTFQGSDIIRSISFSKDHGSCPIIGMNQNYRSAQPILDAANELIHYNLIQSGIDLQSATGMNGQMPRYYHAMTDAEEKEWIAEEIRFLTAPLEEETSECENNDENDDYESENGYDTYSFSQISDYDLAEYVDDPDAEYKFWQAKNELDSFKDAETDEAPEPLGSVYQYNEIAILCKNNALCGAYEKYLQDHGIPAVIVSNAKFYELEIIRTAIAYLALVYNPDNDKAFDLTVNNPSRQIGKDSLKLVNDYAHSKKTSKFKALQQVKIKAHLRVQNYVKIILDFHYRYTCMTLSDLTSKLLDAMRLDSASRPGVTTADLDYLSAFKSIVYDFETSAAAPVGLRALLDYFDECKEYDDTGNKVRISTIHSAKGLEFPVVFVPNIIQGVFPHVKATNARRIAEERRVLYVAITRAQTLLYLSDAEDYVNIPSEFIFELGSTIHHINPMPGFLVRTPVKPKKVYTPANILPVGTRVTHKKLGDGTITRIGYGTYEIQFDNLEKPKTQSFDSVTTIPSAGTTASFMLNAKDFMNAGRSSRQGAPEITYDVADNKFPAELPEAFARENVLRFEESVSVEYPMDYIDSRLLNTTPSPSVLKLIKDGASMNEVEDAMIAEAYPF